ncbi:hypothetical protein CUJ83_02685 [Methanocella sp. CWC-04]|uniref:Uncharacterized protein n=1 Tax=Methanooceanicella nereidis TaxID=2052831 RepID=A0AAP2RAT7_9EURY|nr:hypothetical protein [Methanocella sp. CWC-04]MCD1293903.1 hypothetical protein [Methanocella sp. CWC-04]
MVRKLVAIIMLAFAVALITLPASSSLVPMSWGFPTMSSDHSLTVFENQFAQARDVQGAEIAFGSGFSDFGGVGVSSAFPTILQNADSESLFKQCRFMEERESFCFAYPYLSIGCSPIPSMGFI